MAAVAGPIDTPNSKEPQGVDEGSTYEVLLTCLQRAIHGAGKIEPVSIQIARVCWPSLLELAQRHEVIPLLRLGLSCVPDVPAPVERWLENYCRAVLAHNLSLACELVGVIELFERFHLTAVPYKGPLWTKALYGNLALRQITDLDIFIDKCQIRQVVNLLLSQGYVISPRCRVTPIEQFSRNGRDRDHKDIELIHLTTGIPLELHWSACEPWFDRPLSTRKLWEPASTTTLLDRQMPMPSSEDLFLLLALHGFRHRWESLKWICDIATAIHAFPDLDWASLLAKAVKLSRRRMVLLPLALVQRIFGTQVPPCMDEAIARDPTVRALAFKLQQQHFSAGEGGLGSTSGISRSIYRESIKLLVRENVAERVNLLVSLLFNRFKPTPNDRRYFSPRTLPEPLYWFLRPFRVLSTYSLAFLIRLAGQLITPICNRRTSRANR